MYLQLCMYMCVIDGLIVIISLMHFQCFFSMSPILFAFFVCDPLSWHLKLVLVLFCYLVCLTLQLLLQKYMTWDNFGITKWWILKQFSHSCCNNTIVSLRALVFRLFLACPASQADKIDQQTGWTTPFSSICVVRGVLWRKLLCLQTV